MTSVRQALVEDLIALVGPAHVVATPEALWTYGYDATLGYRGQPIAAAFPATEAQVAALVELAQRCRVPVLARGGATSLAASAVPPDGALVIDTNRLRAVRRLDIARRMAIVEPGLITRDFRDLVAAHGLFYPPDPSSEAGSTLGGNVAANAGGPYAFKYGVTRDYVLGLRLALADGSVAALARPRDSSAIDLIVGSEGTLGIVTQVTLRLLPAPAAHAVRAVAYADALAALRAVPGILRGGLTPAKLEYLDDVTIAALERARPWGLPRDAGALVLAEMDGDPNEVADATAALDAVLAQAGARVPTGDPEHAQRWWDARRAITASLARIRPGKIGEDICLPPTQLAGAVDCIKREAAARELPVAIFGHVADGTLHPNVLYDPASRNETERAFAMLAVIAGVALAAGGVLSGEHGLGRVKRPFVATAYGPDGLAQMRAIKHGLDRRGLLNPGAMWPPE